MDSPNLGARATGPDSWTCTSWLSGSTAAAEVRRCKPRCHVIEREEDVGRLAGAQAETTTENVRSHYSRGFPANTGVGKGWNTVQRPAMVKYFTRNTGFPGNEATDVLCLLSRHRLTAHLQEAIFCFSRSELLPFTQWDRGFGRSCGIKAACSTVSAMRVTIAHPIQ